MLVAIDARCQSSEHKKQDKPLQDFSCTCLDKTKTAAVAFVADGHGGEKYIRSAQGSEIAVICARKQLYDLMKGGLYALIKNKDSEALKKTLTNLCSKIVQDWRTKTKDDYDKNPLTEAEEQKLRELKFTVSDENVCTLYGTTLIVAAYFERYDFWLALQIGDGKCVAFKEDLSEFCPIEEDERLGFGVTTSLCGSYAFEDFRCDCGFEKLAGIAVMTDGMADSFEPEKLPEFIRRIRENVIENQEATKKELQGFLPKLSEQGSGDDISIAAIFAKNGQKNDAGDEIKQVFKEMKENINSQLEDVSKKVEKELDCARESR